MKRTSRVYVLCMLGIALGATVFSAPDAKAFESTQYSITNYTIGTNSATSMRSPRFTLTAALGDAATEPDAATTTDTSNGESRRGARYGSVRSPLPARPVVFVGGGIQSGVVPPPIIAAQQTTTTLHAVAGLSLDMPMNTLDPINAQNEETAFDDSSPATTQQELGFDQRAQTAKFTLGHFSVRLSILFMVIALLAYVRARTRFGKRWSPF